MTRTTYTLAKKKKVVYLIGVSFTADVFHVNASYMQGRGIFKEIK